MCYCSGNTDSLGADIEANESAIEQLAADIKAKTARKEQLDQELVDHKKDRVEAKEAIAKATSIRNKENETFNKESGDQKAYIDALNKAIPAIEKGMGAALIQVPRTVENLKRALAQVSSVSWMCSVRQEGKSDSFSSCGCDDSQTCTYSAPLNAGDGDYKVKAYAAYTYTAYQSTTAALYPSDLGDGNSNTVTSNTIEFDIELDTHAPTIKVTSAPPAKQAYTSDMTVKFAFECDDQHMPCTFQCALDGKNSSKGGKGSRGWFTCSSPVTLTPTHTTTHAFAFRATDAVGNVSPMSDLHTFYTDGTAPKAVFRHTASSSDTVSTLCEDGAGKCRTVMQVDAYDATSDTWDVKDGYEGVVTATRTVNGAKTSLVLDSTSATHANIGFKCEHPEFIDVSDLSA